MSSMSSKLYSTGLTYLYWLWCCQCRKIKNEDSIIYVKSNIRILVWPFSGHIELCYINTLWLVSKLKKKQIRRINLHGFFARWAINESYKQLQLPSPKHELLNGITKYCCLFGSSAHFSQYQHMKHVCYMGH